MNDKTNLSDKPATPAPEDVSEEAPRGKNEPVIDMGKGDGEFLPLPAYWS